MLGEGDPRTETVVGDELIFGNTAPGSIHGFKFYDQNGNGIRDAGRTTATGRRVHVDRDRTRAGIHVNRFETTNEGGEFWFTDLWPSTAYTVMEVVPRGFLTRLQSRARLNWKVVKNSFGETVPRCCRRRRSPLWIRFKLRRH